MLWRAFGLTGLILLSGCATFGAGKIDNVDRPLLDLQKMVVRSLPLGLRKTSPNGREFFSNFFLARDRKFTPAEKLPQRSYAHILILGDARPYDIRIYVYMEAADKVGQPSYHEVGSDSKMAKIIRARLVEQLNKRREDVNIIDDFRVF